MKNTLLLFTLLPFFASAQQTYVPDDNFEAYLENNGMGNGIVNDDSVTTANINSVNELYIVNESISDLTGIEDFTALEVLDCSDNQMMSLDVTQNTGLTHLHCYYNQLTSLDVTQNTALTWLDCSDNQLMSFDVTQNTGLTHLYCSFNQLTSLDVTQNTALTWLFCDENQLTSLDVTQNTALTYLACAWNQLTSLDVTQNTVLASLYAENNQFTSLDVTQNTALISLTCGNQLTSLDLTQNTNLIALGCDYNQLTTLDLSQNTDLQIFTCRGNQLTSLDLSRHTDLTHLACEENQLECLNVKNGNNINIVFLNALYNSDLTCIEVDDPAWATTNWTAADYNIDAGVTFSSNCGNACSSAPTEIGEISPGVALYPNPATDMITVDTEGLIGKIFEVRIYDLRGQLVDQQSNVSRNHIEINTSTFQSGMYWCSVRTNIGQTQVKFIVQ